jgi:hypothetical protein
MATAPEPFYGCLCLETTSSLNNPLPPVGIRQQSNIASPEIHFNIWEGKGMDPFLDIGVMLDINDPAERIEIFLPWGIAAGDIEDLSPRILGPNGVSAVFNEAWTSSGANNCPGGYVTRTDGSIFSIVPYDRPIVETRNHSLGTLRSIVLDVTGLRAISAVTTAGAQRPAVKMYVRIRVKKVPPKFYQVGIDQGDVLGGSLLNRTEIIDFRMNVRRGVPAAIESFLRGRFIEFSKVQLFLMKSRDEDIVFEDKLFKACRSLEDEKFWAEYILPYGASSSASEKSRKRVQRSLGYQWTKIPVTSQTEFSEFGMLARFKSFRTKKRTIGLFVVLALVLGAAGNGVYDLGKSAFAGSDAAARDTKVDAAKLQPNLLKPEMAPKSTANPVAPVGVPVIQLTGKEV